MWATGTPEFTDISGEDLAEPQGVLPSQFFSTAGRAAQVEGERKLMVAVLEDAFRCFRKYASASNRRGRRLFRQAEEWFMEPDTGAALTFDYVCEASGLDAEFIRSRLRVLQRQSLQAARFGERVSSEAPAMDEIFPLKKASGE
jgi:hypothetical protein